MDKQHRQLAFSVSIEECRVDTFTSGGPGGQHQNKVASGVRITHEPSGAIGMARDDRSQFANKKLAWKRMCTDPKFMLWVKLRLGAYLVNDQPPTVTVPKNFKPVHPSKIDEAMRPQNIRVEVLRDNGTWVEVTD